MIPSLSSAEQDLALSIANSEGGYAVVKARDGKPRSLNESISATVGYADHKAARENLAMFPNPEVDLIFSQMAARQFAHQSRGSIELDPNLIRGDELFLKNVLPTMLRQNSKITDINGIPVSELRSHGEEHGPVSVTRVLQNHVLGEVSKTAFSEELDRLTRRDEKSRNEDERREVQERQYRKKKEHDR